MAATYNGSDKRLAYLFENGGGGGGGSANIWTGTKADYEAQASQIADGTQVNITDDEIQSLIVSSYDVYSTEEKEVGVWIDGKPLYQKTFEIPTSGTSTVFNVASLSIDTCVKIEAFMNGAGSVPSGYWYSSSNYLSINYYDNDIFINAPTQSGNSPCVLTIQYTKTTDVAGSGIFVPSGSAAVHYSTTEQIIGTWINGKPLYRKTVSVSVNVNNLLDGNIYHVGVDISSYIPNTAILLPRVDKSYLDLGNNTIRGFIAVLPEDDHYLDVYTAYQRQGTAILTVEYTKTTD